MNQVQIADRNIKLYICIKIFSKRVFLPLSAIFFMDTAGFSIVDIGLLSAFYSVVQLLAEVPTGYFADRVGRVASIRLGALSCAVATLCYVFLHTKVAIFSGTFFEALGYSFLGGAGEALIHDSLVLKKIEDQYTRIMSRTMSLSLVANAILITLVPMTYVYDHRLPFMIGCMAYLSLFTAALFMRDLNRKVTQTKFALPQFKNIVGKRYILLFGLTFGIISGLYSSGTDMFNITLKEFGVRPDLLGGIFGISSIVGALIGPLIQYLRKIKLSSYLLLDLTVVISVYLSAYFRSPSLLAFTIIVGVSFFRYRKIIYQSYLLSLYPTSYKATLISTMNNLEQLNSIWLPLFITYAAFHTSNATGLAIVGVFALIIAPIYYYATLRFFHRDPTPIALANQSVSVV